MQSSPILTRYRLLDTVRRDAQERVRRARSAGCAASWTRRSSAFARKLEGPSSYVWLDRIFVKVRDNGRVVSQAIVIAIAVTATGEREVFGLDVGPSESGAFWLAFLRDLPARGLNGVKLVISDAHAGLRAAICAQARCSEWRLAGSPPPERTE